MRPGALVIVALLVLQFLPVVTVESAGQWWVLENPVVYLAVDGYIEDYAVYPSVVGFDYTVLPPRKTYTPYVNLTFANTNVYIDVGSGVVQVQDGTTDINGTTVTVTHGPTWTYLKIDTTASNAQAWFWIELPNVSLADSSAAITLETNFMTTYTVSGTGVIGLALYGQIAFQTAGPERNSIITKVYGTPPTQTPFIDFNATATVIKTQVAYGKYRSKYSFTGPYWIDKIYIYGYINGTLAINASYIMIREAKNSELGAFKVNGYIYKVQIKPEKTWKGVNNFMPGVKRIVPNMAYISYLLPFMRDANITIITSGMFLFKVNQANFTNVVSLVRKYIDVRDIGLYIVVNETYRVALVIDGVYIYPSFEYPLNGTHKAVYFRGVEKWPDAILYIDTGQPYYTPSYDIVVLEATSPYESFEYKVYVVDSILVVVYKNSASLPDVVIDFARLAKKVVVTTYCPSNVYDLLNATPAKVVVLSPKCAEALLSATAYTAPNGAATVGVYLNVSLPGWPDRYVHLDTNSGTDSHGVDIDTLPQDAVVLGYFATYSGGNVTVNVSRAQLFYVKDYNGKDILFAPTEYFYKFSTIGKETFSSTMVGSYIYTYGDYGLNFIIRVINYMEGYSFVQMPHPYDYTLDIANLTDMGMTFGNSVLAPNMTEIYNLLDSIIYEANVVGIPAKKYSIGHSVQGRPIWAYEIGGGSKKIVFLTQHSDEVSAVISHVYMAMYIIDIAGADQSVNDLLRNEYSVVFIPTINPDPLFNKSCVFDPLGTLNKGRYNCNGVDLNRNYNYSWTQSTTSGSAPFSEPETRAVRDFILNNSVVLIVDVHGSSTRINVYIPFGDTPTSPVEHEYERWLKRAVLKVAPRDRYDYYDLLYAPVWHAYGSSIHGLLIDWARSVGVPAIVVETPVYNYLYNLPAAYNGTYFKVPVFLAAQMEAKYIIDTVIDNLLRPDRVVKPVALNGAELGGDVEWVVGGRVFRGVAMLGVGMEAVVKYRGVVVGRGVLEPGKPLKVNVWKAGSVEVVVDSELGASLASVTVNGTAMRIVVDHPSGVPAEVVLYDVDKPIKVYDDGQLLPEAQGLPLTAPGWFYNETTRTLYIRGSSVFDVVFSEPSPFTDLTQTILEGVVMIVALIFSIIIFVLSIMFGERIRCT